MTESRLVWPENKKLIGFEGTGHPVVVSCQNAGYAVGLKPTDLLMHSLALCSAVDPVRGLARQRQAQAAIEIAVTGEQEPEAMWRLTRMRLLCRLRGRGMNEGSVRKVIEPAEANYCSVAASPYPQVSISRSFELTEGLARSESSIIDHGIIWTTQGTETV